MPAKHEPGDEIENAAEDELIGNVAPGRAVDQGDDLSRHGGRTRFREALGKAREAEDVQNPQHKLNDEEEHHGEQRLVVGEAVADRDGRVEAEASDQHGDEKGQDRFEHERGAVERIVGGELAEQIAETVEEVRRHAGLVGDDETG